MTSLLRKFLRDDSGEDLIEYGLLSSFVAALALATIILDPVGIRTGLVGAFAHAVEALYMAAQTDLVK